MSYVSKKEFDEIETFDEFFQFINSHNLYLHDDRIFRGDDVAVIINDQIEKEVRDAGADFSVLHYNLNHLPKIYEDSYYVNNYGAWEWRVAEEFDLDECKEEIANQLDGCWDEDEEEGE